MLKRPIVLLLLLGGVVLVGVIVAGALREREPEYGGKRLSEWMEVFALNLKPDRDRMTEAFRQMGPAMTPYLLKWLQYREPTAWKKKFRDAFNAAAKRVHLRWVLTDHGRDYAVGAVVAFKTLGEKGKGAIPALSQLIDDPKTQPEIATRATRALSYVGPEAVPALMVVLTNRDALIRSYAGSGLGTLGTNARSAVPALVRSLTDGDFTVRWEATNALRHIEPKALERGTE